MRNKIMKSYWKKCSIQRNMLIAITLFCLARSAYCQTRKKKHNRTTSWYTLLEDNPVYVQDFVSRMMSKYQTETNEKPLRDVAGIDKGANLGYEPYWGNVADLAWDKKCSRCPELFKRYDTVCAVDITGEVMANMTMCDTMRQNCIAGVAYGHSTGRWNDFQGQYFVVANGWARVAFKQSRNALIQLSTTPDTTGDRYSIVIDGWKGWWSGIYRNDRIMKWYENAEIIEHPEYPDKSLWDDEHYVEFVMRWSPTSGWFLITRSNLTDWRKGFHLQIVDENPFPIQYIAVGGNHGYDGDWIIKGFMVRQLTPCLDDMLVTSPTDVPEIFSLHTVINNEYFTRINAAGLGKDKHNVSFLTKEEY